MQTLTFTLPVAPTNASIGSASGVLTWRPLVTQAGTTNPFSVVVTDSGTPSLSTTQNFSVIVNRLTTPRLTLPSLTAGQFSLSVTGQIGPDYAIQHSTNLLNWDTPWTTNPAAMPFTWQTTNTSGQPVQFFRIMVGPPLP